MEILGLHIGRQKRQDEETTTSGTVESNPSDTRVTETAAVVAGVGLYCRAMIAATLDPPILEPWELSAVARDILLHGEWIAPLMLDGIEFSLPRSSNANIQGGVSPNSWRYDLTVPSPSTGTPLMRDVPYSGVAHVRMYTERESPWKGVSPLTMAGVSADLLRCVESGLTEEEDLPRSFVLSHGPSVQNLDRLREDLGMGGISLLEQSAQGWSGGRGQSDNIRSIRIGANPDPSEVSLRAQVSQDILSAMGVPAGMYSPREGSVSREAYRQWHASGVEPMGEALRYELEKKIERPVRISFHKLAAADIQARARAFRSLIDSNVHPEDAAMVAAIPGVRFIMPEPTPPPEV